MSDRRSMTLTMDAHGIYQHWNVVGELDDRGVLTVIITPPEGFVLEGAPMSTSASTPDQLHLEFYPTLKDLDEEED